MALASDVAYAALSVQLTTLQADLAAAGSLDTATAAALAAVTADTAAALDSAQTLVEAHGFVLGAMAAPGLFSAGTPPRQTIANIGLLSVSASAVALATDTANRLARLSRNLAAVGT